MVAYVGSVHRVGAYEPGLKIAKDSNMPFDLFTNIEEAYKWLGIQPTYKSMENRRGKAGAFSSSQFHRFKFSKQNISDQRNEYELPKMQSEGPRQQENMPVLWRISKTTTFV